MRDGQMASTRLGHIISRTNPAEAFGANDSTALEAGAASHSDPLLRQPLVSFVVINLNYAQFVGAAIDSIKSQDYAHFECLVIDNGSSDNSVAVMEKHIAGDERFSLRRMEANRGQLGAAFWALDHIKGSFVVFVDADDILLPTFCSMHLQAHLALARNVAFTSSDVFEINKDREILTSHYSRLVTQEDKGRAGLRNAALVPRLPTVGEEAYASLSERTVLLSRSDWGWIWSPGTSNMFRSSILKLLSFESKSATLLRAADGHFNVLAHALGGSATIGVPLSAYRIHGGNCFVRRESIHGLADGYREYSVRDNELSYQSLEILLSRAEQFWWLADPHYWEMVDCATRSDTPHRLKKYYRSAAARRLFERNASGLRKAMGMKAFVAGVVKRFGVIAGAKVILFGLLFD
jgi:glycosyltransferase involved in cell wall biosynthesis